MLSIEEIKLLIEKLKSLKNTDFQKLIDDNLKILQEFAYSVDAYNTRQIAQLDKTRDWYQRDLEWRENHRQNILDQLLDKQIELKINQFGKMGNNLQNCLEIGPGNGRHVLLLRAWRLMFFTEVLAGCREKIFAKFPPAHQRLLRFYTTDRTACPDIPDNSCNFVFSWDTFPFFTQEHIAEYLRDIHRVILPGGYGFIHYADCDYDADLQEAKRGYWNYNTKTAMKKMLQDTGYEVIEMDQFRPRANYAIFKKPGNANPVVYKIMEIPLPSNEKK